MKDIYQHIVSLQALSNDYFRQMSIYMDDITIPIRNELIRNYNPDTDPRNYTSYTSYNNDCQCKGCRYIMYIYCTYVNTYTKYREPFPTNKSIRYYYEIYYLQKTGKFIHDIIFSIITYLSDCREWPDLFISMYNTHIQNVCILIQPVLRISTNEYMRYDEKKHNICWDDDHTMSYSEYMWYCKLPSIR